MLKSAAGEVIILISCLTGAGFLEELSSVRQHTVGEIPAGHNRNPPMLVHCMAGVGRTGVTILSDLLLYTLDHNQVRTGVGRCIHVVYTYVHIYSVTLSLVYRKQWV